MFDSGSLQHYASSSLGKIAENIVNVINNNHKLRKNDYTVFPKYFTATIIVWEIFFSIAYPIFVDNMVTNVLPLHQYF